MCSSWAGEGCCTGSQVKRWLAVWHSTLADCILQCAAVISQILLVHCLVEGCKEKREDASYTVHRESYIQAVLGGCTVWWWLGPGLCSAAATASGSSATPGPGTATGTASRSYDAATSCTCKLLVQYWCGNRQPAVPATYWCSTGVVPGNQLYCLQTAVLQAAVPAASCTSSTAACSALR